MQIGSGGEDEVEPSLLISDLSWIVSTPRKMSDFFRRRLVNLKTCGPQHQNKKERDRCHSLAKPIGT